MHNGSGASLAASRSERDLRVVQDVTEVKESQVSRRLGLGLRPRFGPVLKDMSPNLFDGGIWIELPRFALSRDKQGIEVNCCGCRKFAGARRRGGRGGRVGWLRAGDLLRISGREQGGRFGLLGFWA